jgi:hypothetical protein
VSYLTPKGFAERATMLDDALEHQIRIKLIESNLVVGCVCTAENIAKIETAADAWMNWQAFHMFAGLTP